MNRISLILGFVSILLGLGSCSSKNATEANFREASASEGTQGVVYEAYARTAKAEGHPSVAALFHALASSEKLHSALLDNKTAPEASVPAVDSTLTNLYHALTNQEFDANNFFPEITRVAAKEKASRAEKTLKLITAAELSSAELIRQAIMSIEASDSTAVILAKAWTVCQKCGTVLAAQPELRDECPSCGKNVKHDAEIFQ